VLYVSTAWSKSEGVRRAHRPTALVLRSQGSLANSPAAAAAMVVNRGLAAWNGKIYVGSYDGHLVALDAKTGAVVWDVITLDHNKPVTSTGAPRAIKGKVLIGNAGGEFGVRGYISAYDAETGEATLALLHRAGRSRGAGRTADHEDRRENLERQLVGPWRRRHRVGRHRLRSETQPRLLRHRQRLAVESCVSRLRRRRQSVPRLDHRAERRHRRVRVGTTRSCPETCGTTTPPRPSCLRT